MTNVYHGDFYDYFSWSTCGSRVLCSVACELLVVTCRVYRDEATGRVKCVTRFSQYLKRLALSGSLPDKMPALAKDLCDSAWRFLGQKLHGKKRTRSLNKKYNSCVPLRKFHVISHVKNIWNWNIFTYEII